MGRDVESGLDWGLHWDLLGFLEARKGTDLIFGMSGAGFSRGRLLEKKGRVRGSGQNHTKLPVTRHKLGDHTPFLCILPSVSLSRMLLSGR